MSCELCGGSYRSVRDLNLHLHTAHRSGGKSGRTRDIFGFKDLTFVDFSSLKFAQIAVHECEKNLHRAQRQHPFQCECGLAFPCDSALVIHRQVELVSTRPLFHSWHGKALSDCCSCSRRRVPTPYT